MENNTFIPAPIKKRLTAFYIDVFIVYLLRFFYINFAIQFWLKDSIIKFLKDYELLYGKVNFNEITNVHLNYFIKSELFSQISYLIVGLFLIPIFYNMLFFFTKWSATIGQKLVNIYVVSKSGDKMNFIQIILRSILLMCPWILSFFVVLNQILSDKNLAPSMSKTTFLLFIFVFFAWFDAVFFTKNKLVFHDYITKTKVVIKDNKKYQNSKSLFRWLFVDSFDKFKANIKNQIQKAREIKDKYKSK